MELTGAYSGTATFAAGSGTLTIDHSANFSGKIGGQLAIRDVIDLADITAGANAKIAYSGKNSPGTLTVSDGTHTASIAFRQLFASKLHRIKRWSWWDIGRRPANPHRPKRRLRIEPTSGAVVATHGVGISLFGVG